MAERSTPRHDIEIATVEIPVGDLRRAVAWYTGHLGFNEEWADEHHAMIGLDAGPKLLLVRTSSAARLGFRCDATGLHHGVLDLRTRDLDGLHARLSSAGGAVDRLDAPGNGWAPRGFGFEDSEGNRLVAFEGPARP